MRITIANLRPAIYLAVEAHCYAISTDTAKAGVPGLDTIKPDIIVGINAV